MVLITPNSIKASTKFEAEIHVFNEPDLGIGAPIQKNTLLNLYIPNTTVIPMHIQFPKDVEMIMLGDTVNVTVTLEKDTILYKDVSFHIESFKENRPIGWGSITKVLE